MWTSFEALCELGVDERTLDPTSVFGVHPHELHFEPPPTADRGILTPTMSFLQTPRDGMYCRLCHAPRTSLTHSCAAAKSIRSEVATPITGFGGPTPKASLFQHDSENLHSVRESKPSKVLFQTPNLTPIPNEHSYYGGHLPPQSAPGSVAPQVVKRAQEVASRRYYEPSPAEARGHPSTASKAQPRSLFLGGLDSSTHNSSFHLKSFSTIVPEESTLHTSILSRELPRTQPRKARAFPNKPDFSTPFASKQGAKIAPPKENDDPTDEGVQKILELLCILGSARLHLGQVGYNHLSLLSPTFMFLTLALFSIARRKPLNCFKDCLKNNSIQDGFSIKSDGPTSRWLIIKTRFVSSLSWNSSSRIECRVWRCCQQLYGKQREK